jgi:hypothetical protein
VRQHGKEDFDGATAAVIMRRQAGLPYCFRRRRGGKFGQRVAVAYDGPITSNQSGPPLGSTAMTVVILAVVVSAIFLGINSAIAHSRFGSGGVALFSVAATFASLCLASPVLIAQSVLTLILALVCASIRSKPKVMVRASVGAMAISFVPALLGSLFERHKLHVIREQFPLESLTDRLAYELRGQESATTTILASPVPMSSQVQERLDQFEKRESSIETIRQYELMRLHWQNNREFESAFGFGYSRMPPLTSRRAKESIVLPEPAPTRLPSKPEQPYTPDVTTAPAAAGEPLDRQRPEKGDLMSIHSAGQEDFLAPDRMGYVSDRDHVAGFESHRFLKLPTLGEQTQAEWNIVRLELVSLLKHETPVAYVSKNLPQMDELQDAPTRPLDDFERRALDRLRTEEDLVIDDTVNRIRMVGSLRAGKDCLQCHSVQRGELLGAFSYELLPTHPVPVKDDEQRTTEPQARRLDLGTRMR